jgi:hypothetical protein
MNLIQKLFGKSPNVDVNPRIDYSQLKNLVTTTLTEYRDKKLEEWKFMNRPELYKGMVVLIDVFNIRKGSNSWDGGGLLPMDVPRTSFVIKPFKVSVECVTANVSLSTDLIDRFWNNWSGTNGMDSSTIISDFERFLSSVSNVYGMKLNNRYGFYYSVNFRDTESGKAYWDRCENSFISDGWMFDKVFTLWNMKYEASLKYEELDAKLKEVKNDMERIGEEILSIKP